MATLLEQLICNIDFSEIDEKSSVSSENDSTLCELLDQLKTEKGYQYTEKLWDAIISLNAEENTKAFAKGIRFAMMLLSELFPENMIK